MVRLWIFQGKSGKEDWGVLGTVVRVCKVERLVFYSINLGFYFSQAWEGGGEL